MGRVNSTANTLTKTPNETQETPNTFPPAANEEPRLKVPPYVALRGVVGTPDCARWRETLFERHWPVMPILVKHYARIAKASSHVMANAWLREANQRLRFANTRLYLHTDIRELDDYAKDKAERLHRRLMQLRQQSFTYAYQASNAAVVFARERLEDLGLSLPNDVDEFSTEEEKAAALARVVDHIWLRKQLRVLQWRQMEAFLRELGEVCLRKGIYVSDFSMARRLQQRDHTARLLQRMVATNQDQQSYTLAELAELSTSNPVNRRNELMTRLDGFECFAQNDTDNHWQGVMFTVTCPSKFHAVHARSGHKNPNYNGSTPREANDYLNLLWQRTRAAWDKEKIKAFGFRVAEAHHDGTPHWHLALFIRKEQLAHAEAIFKRYALAEDGDEAGAQEQRFHSVIIDPNKGRMAGYLAKYIAKNIDGFGIDTDRYGKDAVISAMRIEAWASIWGIRQFQPIGGPSVTVWRELRRLKAEGMDSDQLKAITHAADQGNWAEYTALMGGALCRRKERPLRPYMLPRNALNKYGEVVEAIKGIWHGAHAVISRVHQWTVSFVEPERFPPAANDDSMNAANDDLYTPEHIPEHSPVHSDEPHARTTPSHTAQAQAAPMRAAHPWSTVNNYIPSFFVPSLHAT